MRNRTLVKPSWSPRAYSRLVLTSPRALHIVVEGKRHDCAYYGKIAESSALIVEREYFVTRVDRIYTTGGKDGVLAVFASMKKLGHLVQRSSLGARVAVFVLDRDAEAINGGSKRNPHVFYTSGYDAESDILVNGESGPALTAAVGLAPVDARDLSKILGNWQEDAAHEWREWLVLCVIAARLKLESRAGFARRCVSESDLASLVSTRAELKRRSRLSSSDFATLETEVQRKFTYAFQKGKGHTLVKGKWLPAYLSQRIVTHFPTGGCPDLNDFEKRVVSSYLGALDARQPWADRYRGAWEQLLKS